MWESFCSHISAQQLLTNKDTREKPMHKHRNFTPPFYLFAIIPAKIFTRLDESTDKVKVPFPLDLEQLLLEQVWICLGLFL